MCIMQTKVPVLLFDEGENIYCIHKKTLIYHYLDYIFSYKCYNKMIQYKNLYGGNNGRLCYIKKRKKSI